MNLIVKLRKIQDREIDRFWVIGKNVDLMESERYITKLNSIGNTPVLSWFRKWLIEKEVKQFIKKYYGSNT